MLLCWTIQQKETRVSSNMNQICLIIFFLQYHVYSMIYLFVYLFILFMIISFLGGD